MEENKLDLDRIAFIGRTYREYTAIFGLDDTTLKAGRVLDCPAGASSFSAEACARGYDAAACDLLYGMKPAELVAKAKRDTDYALEQAYKVMDLYDWGFYGDVAGHRAEREHALTIFSRDYAKRFCTGRYVQATLPALPFADGEFSLVLSGHFLFLYADRLDFGFHLSCIQEMLRVGREVRIFPILGLDAKPYPRLDELVSELSSRGHKAELVRVPFEFMKGGDRMLRVSR